MQYTGKERDTETGLDYFGARYFSGAQGRFTSPDPPLLDQHIADPQSWNLYAYGLNNPLKYVDPSGNLVELLGNQMERDKELALLKKSVGSDKAAAQIGVKTVKDGDTTHYLVEIKGDIGKFIKLSESAHDLGNLVTNKSTVEFGLTSRDLSSLGGAATFGKGEDGGNQNVRILVNPDQLHVADRNLDPRTILGAGRWGGRNQDPPWRVNSFTPEIATWHEFGHAWGFINGRIDAASNSEAVQWENRMRVQLYGPTGPRNSPRIRH